MTVWSELQSWIGAAASDVALDNEFKNIYLGLNEAANGNLPSGYNRVDLTFTGASLTIKGETKMGALNVPLDSTLTVAGAAGWRYIVTTNGGVMSVESIPGAEITADTQVYTPTPVFNTSANGYYSTVNTARRIVGVCYFDATNIKEVLAYGTAKKRNDDYWRNAVSGTELLSTAGDRLRFTDAMLYSRGSNVTIVDNGYGSTDAYGCKITNLENSPITISGLIDFTSISTSANGAVSLYKNGSVFIANIGAVYLVGASSASVPFTIIDKHAQANDYYTFVVVIASNVGIIMINIEVTK